MTAHDRQQFGELLESHRNIVFKVANTYCWHPEDRADVAQEIATQLWRAFPAYDPKRRFSTWMYRIALNVAISYVRSNAYRLRHSIAFDETVHDCADETTADDDVGEHVRLLHQCIDRLDALDRALMLLYLEERSYREISEILGMSETNVGTRISRLRERIRNDFNTEHDDGT